MLDGQVERRMRAAIKTIGDMWYTCWVDAGQPDLTALLNQTEQLIEADTVELPQIPVRTRSHEGLGRLSPELVPGVTLDHTLVAQQYYLMPTVQNVLEQQLGWKK